MREITFLVTVAALLAGALTTNGQGSLVFRVPMDGASVVPAVDTPAVGGGRLELIGGSLEYNVGLQVEWFDPKGGFIQGPALPGQNGPLLFDLGQRGVFPGPDATLRFQFVGTVEVTPAQAADLTSGLWYLVFTSPQHPEGHIRGQILLVPEPSTSLLVLVGVGFMWLLTRRKDGRNHVGHRGSFRGALLMAIGVALPWRASAQGTLEFRTIIPDDFVCVPGDPVCVPHGGGRLVRREDRVEFSITHGSAQYLPYYVGHLHTGDAQGMMEHSFQLPDYGTVTGVMEPLEVSRVHSARGAAAG